MLQFQSYIVKINNQGLPEREVVTRSKEDLPAGELLIKVCYSSLNYKDALSASGNRGVTSHYPHVPGVDAAGIVTESDSPDFTPGEKVVVTGYDFGMNTDGGFQQYARIPAEWAVKLPADLSLFDAMCYGTAGLTAAQSVEKLTSVVAPDDGPILVSGATGGVGSFSVAMLSKLGYRVIATTGKTTQADYLLKLGANEIQNRSLWEESVDTPLLKGSLGGGIDTVGGTQLENMIKSTRLYGAVTCCGMIASSELKVSIFPFILRGITLFGISSQNLDKQKREKLWLKIAEKYRVPDLESMVTVIGMEEIEEYIGRILSGKIHGRVVIDLWQEPKAV